MHAVERWVHGALGTIEHERRVRRIATALFDLTVDRHGLGDAHRRLLRMAAMVHDVGRAVNDDRHPAIGARMVLAARQLPLLRSQRRQLAYLTRCHRGRIADDAAEALLRREERRPMRILLALLQAADALDRRRLAPPRIVLGRRKRVLRVICYVPGKSRRARRTYRRRKKFSLLRQTLRFRVDIDVRRHRRLELAA